MKKNTIVIWLCFVLIFAVVTGVTLYGKFNNKTTLVPPPVPTDLHFVK